MADDYFDDDDYNRAISKNVYFEEEESSHQLEDFFGVEENSTMVRRAKHIARELIDHGEYDDKDKEIEEDLDFIYQRAVEAYEESMETRFSDDPKSEMLAKSQANEFLKTALQATKERASIKTNKDKMVVSREKIKSSEKINSGDTVRMDRNELLRMLRSETFDEEAEEGEIIDE